MKISIGLAGGRLMDPRSWLRANVEFDIICIIRSYVTASQHRQFTGCMKLLALILFSSALSAQSFDVASIHRNLNGGQNTGIHLLPGGRISVTNATLKTLIRNAYGVLSFQLGNEPGWLDTEFYDLEATTTGIPGELSEQQLKPALQTLLAERFHLKVHWETREAPIYTLLVDKNGSKLRENTEGKPPGINSQRNNGKVRMKGVGVPIAMLASNISNQLQRVVVDKTGLTGAYDFEGNWELETSADSSGGPSIFTAMRELFGLRLESGKGPTEVLVIDSADHATEN